MTLLQQPSKLKLPNLPRYTSYPTAPHFTAVQALKAEQVLLEEITTDQPVSVYIHIPFCDRLCWFCGCHTKHTLKYEPIAIYVEHVVKEITTFSKRLGFNPLLSNLHFGGGSPSMLQLREAKKLRQALETALIFTQDAEISVEVDPNDVNAETLKALQALGMNRASIGVQDFAPIVQKAINRPQGYEDTAGLVTDLRSINISSLNIDALYGLPFQTRDSIAQTSKEVVSLSPDRIALFGYAHVPQFKKHQRMIDETALPDDHERIVQSNIARDIYINSGYVPIGIDHFAKPDDALAKAKVSGSLRRNFQGYTTDPCEILIGFGASSISRSSSIHLQNEVATRSYQDKTSKGKSVASRGFVMGLDDKIRGMIIETLMCDFEISTSSVAKRFAEAATPYLAEIDRIGKEDDGEFCSYDGETLKMKPEQRHMVRLIASRFDAYLDSGASTYSKAV